MPSEGEGMIPAESRMREIRTSGSTSGGVETDRMGAGLSTKRKRGQMKHRTLPGTAPPPDSTYLRNKNPVADMALATTDLNP